jgi:hypothetical protein
MGVIVFLIKIFSYESQNCIALEKCVAIRVEMARVLARPDVQRILSDAMHISDPPHHFFALFFARIQQDRQILFIASLHECHDFANFGLHRF